MEEFFSWDTALATHHSHYLKFFTFAVLIFSTCCSCHVMKPIDQKSPLVLVPGDGGSQAYCMPKDGKAAYLIWINLWYFLSPGYLADKFSVVFDPTTGNLSDTELCDVVFPGWGDTWSIENLDTSRHSATVYFEDLVSALKKDPFFVSNKTLRGAPFDFRKAPNQSPTFVEDLKCLIEGTFVEAGNRRVVLLGHSLGSLYSLAFLNSMSVSWKRKYIKAFLSVSGPLAGSVKALKIEASGDNFGVFLLSPVRFRDVQRSLPSLAFLLPDPRLWPPTEPILITPKVNYSAHDYEKLFSDLGFSEGYQLMLNTKPSVDGLIGPSGVDEIYCVHGVGVQTIYQVIYSEPSFTKSGFPDRYSDFIYGPGDGTVHTRSLELCRFWPKAQYMVMEGAEHLKIVGDTRLIELVRRVTGSEIPS